jgi:hypothetical protein
MLGLPPGMLDVAKPIVVASTGLDLGSQPAVTPPDVGNAVFDGMFRSTAMKNWSTAPNDLLGKLFGASSGERTTEIPSPAKVYFRNWKVPVMGLLMVAKVWRTKFDVTEPFLLVLQFPTVMPRVYSGDVFTEPSPKARLLPGQCSFVPHGGIMPSICGGLRDLRKLSVKGR